MKIKTKKNYLLGILLSAFLIIGIINITNGEPNVINTNPDSSKLHTASLRSLFLGDSDVDTGFSWMRVNTGGSSLDILNGLIVGSVNSVSQGSKMVVIGGGRGNSVNASNAGIAGGSGNAVDGENGAIGGGLGNMGKGIIAGGNNNKIDDVLGVILGGFKNISKGGIVLGGSGNMAGENSMAFGQNAKGDKNSFAWNAHALQNSARIDASGGMLIGTYSPVSGVYLVVSGSVKLGSGKFDSTTGGVWVNENGCIKASDGGVLYTLGRSSESDSKCGIASGCQFGKTMLHNGDKVTGYPVSYASKCEEKAETVTCIDGKFYDSGNNLKDVVYPYCYDLSPDPVLTLTGGIKQCSGLPTNAKWVNGYFKQKLENGKWTPEVKTGVYSLDSSVECSFTCDTNYDWNGTSCAARIYQCTGPEPSNAVLVPGSTGGLTAYVENKLYPSRTEAGNNKCAYVCKVAEKFVYDPDYGKCTKINTFCSETTPYKCEYSATVTNTGGNDNEYTWDCAVDGTSVEVGCFKCKNGYTWDGTKCVRESVVNWECKKDLNIGGTCKGITPKAWCKRHVPSTRCYYNDGHGIPHLNDWGLCHMCYGSEHNDISYVDCSSLEGARSCNRSYYCDRKYEIDSNYDYVCVDSEGNILSDSDCDGLPAIDCSEKFIDDNGGEVSPDEAPRCGGYMKCGSGDPVVTNGGNWKCVNDDGDEVCCGCSTRCPCGYEYDNISKKCKINKKYCVYEQWDAVGPCFDTPGNNERTMPAGFAVKITGLGKKLEPREGYLAGLVWIDTAYGNVPGAQELSSCVSLPIDFDRCAGELKHADVLGEYNQGYYLTSCRVDGQSYSEMEPSDEYCVVDDGNMYCPVSG